jgi:hypothetical protein
VVQRYDITVDGDACLNIDPDKPGEDWGEWVKHEDYLTTERQKGEIEGYVASIIDLVNSWAREIGADEATGIDDLKQTIDGIWAATSQKTYRLGRDDPFDEKRKDMPF